MNAYEDMIRHTATPHAPWYVVPADHKWFTRLVVGSAIVETLQDLKLDYPKVDSARRKQTEKHGGNRVRVDLPDDVAAPAAPSDDLVALDEALTRLEGHDPDAARLVKLRYFAGLSHQEAADALGVSRGAADRLWALARAWLLRQLSK